MRASSREEASLLEGFLPVGIPGRLLLPIPTLDATVGIDEEHWGICSSPLRDPLFFLLLSTNVLLAAQESIPLLTTESRPSRRRRGERVAAFFHAGLLLGEGGLEAELLTKKSARSRSPLEERRFDHTITEPHDHRNISLGTGIWPTDRETSMND